MKGGGHIWFALATVFIMGKALAQADPTNDLLCYQCENSDQDECRKLKYLKTCPNDQAYDTCQSIITRLPGAENATVTKSCALSPCFLDSSADNGLGMSKSCDQTRESFQCVSCCRENACNGGNGMPHAADSMLWLLLSAAVAVAVGGRR